jgi:CheY-like chemotaxis protein
VLHELVTNARKYGALTMQTGRILVETSVTEVGNVVVVWTESGGPMVVQPTRRGFGTTILEQAIPFEVNGQSTPRFLPNGFVLEMVLPAPVANIVPSGVFTDARVVERAQNRGDEKALEILLHTTLVVEDNLFIAIDAEDLLRKLGASRVDIARSVPEALALVEKCHHTFALLDVNLAPNTSLPVARALQARNIPFGFGTGYGEGLALTDIMANVPIIAKPYHRSGLEEFLTRFLPATDSEYSTPHDVSA